MSSSSGSQDISGKNVFVTVGTTRFDKLISATTSPIALKWFISQGYSSITIQYGTGIQPSINHDTTFPVNIRYYDFQPSLIADMEKADLIISHAGAGTIMEALRLHKTLIVVINTLLMDNHQEELACAMAERGELLRIGNPELLEDETTWMTFQNFAPTFHEPGDDQDFPRLLDSFLGFTTSKDD